MNFFSYITFRIKSISYPRKLFLSYFILIFLPLTALSIFFYIHMSTAQLKNFTNLSNLHLNQATTAMETRISEMISITKSLSMQESLRTCLEKNPASCSIIEQAKDLEEIEILIGSHYYDSSTYQIRLYVNPDFKYADKSNTTWSLNKIDEHFPNSDYEIFKGPRLHGPFQLNLGLENYISVFSLTMPIYGIKNYDHALGLICIDIFEEAILDILKTTDYSKSGEAYLTDSSGYPLIGYQSSTDSILVYNTPTFKFDVNEPFALSKNNLTVISPLIQGTWHLIVSSPTDFSTTNGITLIQLILFVFVIGIIVYILAYIYAHFNSKRIISLSNTVQKIQQGDLSVHCIVDSYDEIGDLQVNINEMIDRIKNLLSEQYNMGVQLKNSDLKLLQAQINPHFLYNTLNLIKWTAQTQNSDEVADIVDKLSNFYRISLSNGLDLITIKDEIRHVTLYVQLQNKRFNNNIHLETNISPDVSDLLILKLLLQPLVENSIVHGLKNKPGFIKINICKTSDYLSLIISDNGCGISSEKLGKIIFYQELGLDSSSSSGYGLVNIYERLQNYYGDNSKLNITSKIDVGTTVEISLPIEMVEKTCCLQDHQRCGSTEDQANQRSDFSGCQIQCNV